MYYRPIQPKPEVKKRPRLSIEEKSRLVNLYLSDDLTLQEFCIIQGLRRATMYAYLKEHELLSKKISFVTDKERLAMYRMVEIGIPYKAIAKTLGLAVVTVKMNLIKLRKKLRATGKTIEELE